MKIVKLKTKSKKFKDFKNKEWENISHEHYGHARDPKVWENKKVLYKATEGNDILGILSGEAMAGAFHLQELVVTEKARGKGIGSKLLGVVLDKIKQDSSIKTVRLSVNKEQISAVRLYEKFGFQITGEESQKMGDGNDHTEYLMELVLQR